MYIHIYSATRNTIARILRPKNVNPRRFLLTTHSFSFQPFSFPRHSLTFSFRRLSWKYYKRGSLSARLSRKAPLEFGNRRIRRGKAPTRSDNGSLTSPLSRLRASIHAFLPFPSCLLRCRLAPGHKDITMSLSSAPCVSPPGPIFAFL